MVTMTKADSRVMTTPRRGFVMSAGEWATMRLGVDDHWLSKATNTGEWATWPAMLLLQAGGTTGQEKRKEKKLRVVVEIKESTKDNTCSEYQWMKTPR